MMIDKMLTIGATFDFISPLAKVLGDVAHGGGYTFTFPACQMTPREIEAALRHRGITTWGLMHVDGTTMITVRKSDAGRASQVLQQHGVPVENPAAGQPQPRKARGGASPFRVFDIFD